MEGLPQPSPSRRPQLLQLHSPTSALVAAARTSPTSGTSGRTSPSSAIVTFPSEQPQQAEQQQNYQQLASFPPMPPPKVLHKQLSFQSSSSTGPGASSGIPSLMTHTYSMLEAQQSNLRAMLGGQHLKSPSISESLGSIDEDDRAPTGGFRSPLIEAMGPDGPIVPLPPPMALDPSTHRAYEPPQVLRDVPLILAPGMGGLENLQDPSTASFASADVFAFSARRKSMSCLSQSGEAPTSFSHRRLESYSLGGEGSRRNSIGLNYVSFPVKEASGAEGNSNAITSTSAFLGAHLSPPPAAVPAVPHLTGGVPNPSFHSLQQVYPLAAGCGDLPFGLKHDVILHSNSQDDARHDDPPNPKQ